MNIYGGHVNYTIALVVLVNSYEKSYCFVEGDTTRSFPTSAGSRPKL